jgi:hypothetical protein
MATFSIGYGAAVLDYRREDPYLREREMGYHADKPLRYRHLSAFL